MNLNEAIATLMDRAERWAEFHEHAADACEDFEPASDDDDGYGHDTCAETRSLNEAYDAASEYLRQTPPPYVQAGYTFRPEGSQDTLNDAVCPNGDSCAHLGRFHSPTVGCVVEDGGDYCPCGLAPVLREATNGTYAVWRMATEQGDPDPDDESFDPDGNYLVSEIISAAGYNPRCDLCGGVQLPGDEWNGDTGNHPTCERLRAGFEDGTLAAMAV